jgi:serine protease AprX
MTLKRLSQVITVGALLSLALPSTAAAQQGAGFKNHKKIDRALRNSREQGSSTERVIIRTRPGTRHAISQALKAHGDVVDADYADLNAIAAEIHADDLAALVDSQSVLSVSVDATVRADGRDRRSTRSSRQTRKADSVIKTTGQTLAKVNEEILRGTLGLSESSLVGTGVVVAVIDSGIAALPDFRGRIAAFLDCTSPACEPTFPSDDYGHGTHVAGLIAGSNSGVAPGATLIGLKVLDETGSGRTSDVIKALQWVRANKQRHNIQVANLSLGHPIYEKAETDPLVLAVQETVRAGVKVLVAAGNIGINPETGKPGYGGITSPGNSPSAITVGALQTFNTVGRDDDRVAPYSSRGPTWYDGFLKPDLVAPGDALMAPLPTNSTLMAKASERGYAEGQYTRLSGTSMATAVASGVVALVLEANGRHDVLTSKRLHPLTTSLLSTGTVKALLQFTAIQVRDDSGELYDELTQGAGGLNAGGALELAARIDGSIAAPEYWLTGAPTGPFGATVIDDHSYAWRQSILWDDNIVWGSGLVTHHQAFWDDNIVWGSSDDNIVWGSLLGDDNIVWGSADDDNIVWGSLADWADNIVWGSGLIGLNLGDDNIVWGSFEFDNIVWGSLDLDNIVWGSLDLDNIVWGSLDLDNIVWGSHDLDNIVWGSDVLLVGGTTR